MNRVLHIIIFILVISAISGCLSPKPKKSGSLPAVPADTTEATNDFYDNEVTHFLPTELVVIDGETSETITIDLNNMPLHSVIVKETRLEGDSNRFVGAYRYDGPSLYDILNNCPLVKKNAAEFNPIIDAYVEISNAAGEKAVFSWGEIFYPIHRHEIIIGTQVMQIVPSKTKDYWPLPEKARVVAAADLLTERNISQPTKITIKSLDRDFEVRKNLQPMYSPEIRLYDRGNEIVQIMAMPEGTEMNYPNIFYGRGRGIHAVTPFEGIMLKEVLHPHFPLTRDALQKGIFTISAADGYRAAFTYSEIMNRNDQSEVLLIDEAGNDGGAFLIYPAADFFSDRAIKSVSGIWYDEN